MLSRAATSLTVLGRQLERADNLARVLDVHLNLALDRSDEPGSGFWAGLMKLAGWAGADIDRRDQAVELIVSGSAGPSVRRSVALARAAAQSVRPSLPSELYEQVNRLYWRIEEESAERDLHEYLIGVQLGIRLVDGLIEDTMLHDEAREFVRLGKFLERADNVVALVTRKSAELAGMDDVLEWTAALKSSFGFESYRVRFSVPVSGDKVIDFLLFDPTLPRSGRFAVDAALACVRGIDGERARSRPILAMARLVALFISAQPALVAAEPRAFSAEFAVLRRHVTDVFRAAYFQPSRVSATVPGDATGRIPQQQQ